MNIKPKSTIEVYTDKDQYIAGETVQGKVLLRIKKEIKTTELFIALVGEIYCKTYVHTADKKLGKWVDIDVKEEKKKLFHLKSFLYKFDDDKVKKGEFNVKFNFQLPEEIDYASMYCKGSYGISRDASQHYQQHVRYNLIAWFQPKAKKKKVQLSGKQIIHIQKIHRFDDLLPKVFMRKNFNFCYCFNTGHIEMGLKLEKLEYKASEQMKFDFEYENYPPGDRKPLSLRWQILRRMIFKGNVFEKIYSQGEIDNCLQKSHTKIIELPLAMTMTHKSQFVEVQNIFQIEYCLPNDVFIPICQEFAIIQQNSNIYQKTNNNQSQYKNNENKLKNNDKDFNDDNDKQSDGSRLSDANREEIVVSQVNWNKCNSVLEEIPCMQAPKFNN